MYVLKVNDAEAWALLRALQIALEYPNVEGPALMKFEYEKVEAAGKRLVEALNGAGDESAHEA